MKDFILICDKNCATYKEVFPLFKEGIISFGSPVKEYEGIDRKFGNHSWITTFPVPNKKKLVLTASYAPALYPKYDNYDAIEVSRIKNIPYDYNGVMGVPITILDYDLDNVEIVRFRKGDDGKDLYIGGEDKYFSVLIKKNFEIQGIWNDKREEADFIVKGTPTYLDEKHKSFQGPVVDGKAKYARVLLRRKN